MELICRIEDQMALTEREFTDTQGMPQKFASMGFLLSHGGTRVYAEMVQEQAHACPQLPRNCYYVANLSVRARKWQDAQGADRYENRIVINSLTVL